MDSSATRNHHPHRKQCDGVSLAGKRRISSFSSSTSTSTSSSSSSSSSSVDDSLLGPATPLRFISRIPFSWEHFPGIPKNHHSQNNKIESSSSSSNKLLPLPPPTTTHLEDHPIRTRKKNAIQGSFQRDPFFAALVECSKSKNDCDVNEEEAAPGWNNNNNNNVAKVSRSLSDRFEFISLFASCKRSCAVSESLVYLPSSRRTS